MQSAEQRRRLLSEHDYRATQPIAALARCAAGIGVLVLVAAGPWLLLGAEPGTIAGGPPAVHAGPAPAESALAASKRIFDERRQRYLAARQGGTPEAAELAPAALSSLK